MTKPTVLNAIMNEGWKKFLKTEPDLTEAMAWIVENVTEKIVNLFQRKHKYKG